MNQKPKELFWVEKAGGGRLPYNRGAGGGKVSSLEAAQDRKRDIIRRVPDAVVRIYRAETVWVEVK